MFEAYATAYMVMIFEQGQSFATWLKTLGRSPTQEELDRIAGPLLDALEMMHAESFLHRDIAPDNIIVRADGTPVLLDFGAARRAVGEKSETLTGVVKSGYSPHEQYATDGRLQGPWTDIYAFGATLYRAVTGKTPEEATLRMTDDRLAPAVVAATGTYRPGFLSAIDACLKVRPSERPQSVAELRPMLLSPVHVTTARMVETRKTGETQSALARSARSAKGWWAAAAALALVGGVYGGLQYTRWHAEQRGRAEIEANRRADQQRQAEAIKKADEEALEKARAEAEAKRKAEGEAKREPWKPPLDRVLTADEERSITPGQEFQECKDCPRMIVVPAGEFLMGSPASEPGRREFEGPLHKVSLRANFAVGRHAITRDQFKAFVDATGYQYGESCHAQAADGWVDKPGHSFLSPPGFSQEGDHPVVCVSWKDANAYAKWLSAQTQKTYRLLTEAEREYIARAGTATPYWWGMTVSPEQANFDTQPRPSTSPRDTTAPAWERGEPGVAVGRTQPVGWGLPNPWGIFQVHGNVADWVQDCWNPDYSHTPGDGSAAHGGDCTRRVVRGGAWSSWAEDIRAAYREMAGQDDRFYSVGFRVARDLGN